MCSYTSDQLTAFRIPDRRSPQQVIDLYSRVGLIIAVFENDGRVDGKAPIFAGAACDGPGAWDDYGILEITFIVRRVAGGCAT